MSYIPKDVRVYTIQEVQEKLGVSRQMVYEYIKKGEIRPIDKDYRVYFEADEVDEFAWVRNTFEPTIKKWLNSLTTKNKEDLLKEIFPTTFIEKTIQGVIK